LEADSIEDNLVEEAADEPLQDILELEGLIQTQQLPSLENCDDSDPSGRRLRLLMHT
jgi:hypothetical protein